MRSIFILVIVSVLSLLLVAPSFAQTEDELVAKFLKRTEKKQIKKVGFFVLNGTYGKLSDNSDYNQFTEYVSPLMVTATGGPAGVFGIWRTKELYAGFGMLTTPKSSTTIGFTYWLKMGSSTDGDFNLTLLNLGDSDPRTEFELKSQVQVYGFSSTFEYYLLNHPDREGVLKNVALKAGLGAGFYFANWDLWDGFTGYNLSTAEPTVIEGNLTGSAPGFTLSLGAEVPVPLGNLVFEGALQYMYLNFSSMKWYNDNNEENVVVYNSDLERVELDLSGPRARFGLKRYFSW